MYQEMKFSSGKQANSALIWSGPCFYHGFVALTGGANITVTLYDALTATGNEVEDFICDGNKPTDGHSHSNPVVCRTGLYANISGGSIVVYYRQKTGG